MKHWPAAGAAVILGALAAAPSYSFDAADPAQLVDQLAAKPVLSGEDLVALAARVEAGDDAGLGVLAGKPFKVVIAPDPSSAEGPRWWYDKTHQALSLHAPIGMLSGQFAALPRCRSDTTARGIEIGRENLDRRIAGQTPDGEPRAYDQRRQYRVSLGGLACGAPAAPSGLNAAVNESPKAAEAQTPLLQATIEGTLRPADGEALVVCAGERMAPTTEKPTELVIHQCVVGAKIQRIAFSAGDAEIASWSAERRLAPASAKRPWMTVPPLQDLH